MGEKYKVAYNGNTQYSNKYLKNVTFVRYSTYLLSTIVHHHHHQNSLCGNIFWNYTVRPSSKAQLWESMKRSTGALCCFSLVTHLHKQPPKTQTQLCVGWKTFAKSFHSCALVESPCRLLEHLGWMRLYLQSFLRTALQFNISATRWQHHTGDEMVRRSDVWVHLNI